jgi:F0F1-type ATP synthase membrane subunit c/vacuolar-type H+-ATPase subunit K
VSGFVKNWRLQRSGSKQSVTGDMAGIAKWFVRLLTLMVAFGALGLPAVSDVLRQLLMWLPNLDVALVALVIGGIAANALGEVVRNAAVKGELENPAFLAAVAHNAVWVFAIVVAINQVGIAATLVNIFFIGVVAALALALGLSFGLGGRSPRAPCCAASKRACDRQSASKRKPPARTPTRTNPTKASSPQRAAPHAGRPPRGPYTRRA